MKNSGILVLAALVLSGMAVPGQPAPDGGMNGPPETAYVFRSMTPSEGTEALSEWYAHCTVATSNTQGRSFGNISGIAQSFIPGCDRITAVELSAWPVDGIGWIRFDVHEDRHNRPSDYILCRTWLHVAGPPSFSSDDYMVFDIPDIDVTASNTYWFTVVEFIAKESPIQSLTNVGFSQGSQYPGGRLLRRNHFEYTADEDVLFRILSNSPAVPVLRSPDDGERASIPRSNGDWREIPPRGDDERGSSTWSGKLLGLTGRLALLPGPYDSGTVLSLDLYNDSGRTLLIPMWNTENMILRVWSGDQELKPDTAGFFMMTGQDPERIALPSHGRIMFSMPNHGGFHRSGDKVLLNWNRQSWALSPGTYEVRGEYRAAPGSRAGAENTYDWEGRLTLPPLPITVREDGTLLRP